MRALQLDYQRVQRPVPWLGVAVLVAAIASLGALAVAYQSLIEQVRALENQADRALRDARQSQPAARPLSGPAMHAQLLEVRQANQVVRELRVPWNTLFKAVESAGGEGIGLLSLEPDTQKGTAKISGEAKNLDALLDYVKRLAAQEVFSGVLLQSHQVQAEIAEKPLRFTVIAQWQVAAP